jgi:hypothetical protein
VGFGDTFDQGQSQAGAGSFELGAAGAVVFGVVDAEELIKNPLVIFGVNANPIIGDDNLNRLAANFVIEDRATSDGDQTAVRGIFDSVTDEVFKAMRRSSRVER